MKKHLLIPALIIMLLPNLVHATDKPKIDPYNEIVDAEKIEITGTAEPKARIQVIGGAYNIPPVSAYESGKFSITLALTQESENSFTFTATGADGQVSEEVTIIITENAKLAKKEAEKSGIDTLAPTAPLINLYPAEIARENVIITGTAEAESKITVTGTQETSTNTTKNGEFSVILELEPGKVNKFYFSTVDQAKNTSKAVTVEITSTLKTEDEKEIAPPFTDIQNHWGETYIEELRLKGIIGGKEPGLYGPDDFITRAALTKIAVEAAGLEIIKAGQPPFPDVPLDQWFTDYINTAKVNQIVAGFPDGTFGPDKFITRAAALKILLEGIYASGIEAEFKETDQNFPDAKNEWFSKYTSFGKENQIVGGNPDGNFLPGDSISRAGVAKIAANIIELRNTSLPTINDETRTTHLLKLLNAINAYEKKNKQLPTTLEEYSLETFFNEKICEKLFPEFLESIPTDPYFSRKDTKNCQDLNTGYSLRMIDKNTFRLAAPYAESQDIWLENTHE